MSEAPRPPLHDFIRDFIRLLRPEFWLVCLLPLYLGYVLGAHAFLPQQARLVELVHRMLTRGLSTHEFVAGFGSWFGDARSLWFALLALGPFIWGATLLFNDYWDLDLDRENPRRRRSPLVLQRITPSVALWGSLLVGALGLFLAALVSPIFFGAMAACVALSWAYSAPPLQLKRRAGGDIAVNVIGIGVICGLAGWSIAAPLRGFPWIFLAQGVLVIVSLYIPSMMWDHEYDKAGGARTFVVAVGPRVAYRTGLVLLVASLIGACALAWSGYVMPRGFLAVLIPTAFLLVVEYVHYIGRWNDPERLLRGIIILSLTFGASHVLFLFVYTGLWRI